jgi:hypothetical protein
MVSIESCKTLPMLSNITYLYLTDTLSFHTARVPGTDTNVSPVAQIPPAIEGINMKMYSYLQEKDVSGNKLYAETEDISTQAVSSISNVSCRNGYRCLNKKLSLANTFRAVCLL